MSGQPFNISHTTPFVEEVIFVFERMLHWEVECESIGTKTDWTPTHFASGVVSLCGGFQGKVALSFPARLACRIAQELLRYPMSRVNDDVVDAICELTNTVTGRALPRLSKHCTSLGVPEAVIGRARPIEYPLGVSPIVVRFRGEVESFALEVGMIERALAGAENAAALCGTQPTHGERNHASQIF